MSKERDLLNKAIELIQIVPMMASIGNVPPDFGSELILEIQELLAQPEQEPVAWMYDLDMMIHPISNTRSQRFGQLTAIDPTNRQQDAVNIRPLYLAPPKREPLSQDEIYKLYQWVSFTELTRIIEKAHGIGGGE